MARTPAVAVASTHASPAATGHNLFKILFVQRARSSGFMASAHVFPGGVLDKADEEPLRLTSPAGRFPLRPDKGDTMAMRICALRELFEETGLLLARPSSSGAAADASGAAAPTANDLYSSAHSFSSLSVQQEAQKACSSSATSLSALLQREGLQLEPAKLAPWSRWITPVFEKRRYDTMFYLAALPTPFLSLSGDPREVSSTLWLSPSEALSLAQRREIVLPPPTTYLLREIERARTIEDVLSHAHARTISPILPRLLPKEAVPNAPAPHNDAQDAQASGSSGSSAKVLHISLPGDPCYPLDDAGALSDSCRLDVARPLTDQKQRWHRMVRSTDPANPVTEIYRPADQHLTFAGTPLAAKL